MAGAEIPEIPSAEWRDRLVRVLEPLRRITRPEVLGLDRVPQRRALLVGNHTIYGLLDLPFLLAELHRRRGLAVRSLGDHAHFAVPAWRELLAACGMVRGTRANCAELMRRGEVVMVFPGGGREVAKRRGEAYTLIWGNRLGFARMAIEHEYPIVPLGMVGAEEAYDIRLDGDSPVLAPFRAVARRLTGMKDPMPLATGIGPTLIPKPQRLYFGFGEPISTLPYRGRAGEEAACRAVRDRTREAVEAQIELLRAERERDPDRGLLSALTHPGRAAGGEGGARSEPGG